LEGGCFFNIVLKNTRRQIEVQKQKAPPRNMRVLISFDKEGVIEKWD